MALLITVLTKIKKLFIVLFAVLKKPFCCRRRNRRNSGMILPMTVDTTNHFNVYQPLNNAMNTSNEWTHSQHNTQHMNSSVNPNINSNKTNFQSNVSMNTNINNKLENNGSEEQKSETDFFKDMVPEFRKPKKILLASNQSNDTQMSNRFGVDMKATIIQSKELGVIEHFEDGSSSWEDNAANEEMWDTDQSLRDVRQAEREKRIAEHQRIKFEKESKRLKQPKTGNLLATKIT